MQGICIQSGIIDAGTINIQSLPTSVYAIRIYKDYQQIVEKI
jgi:hypothetical protein